MKSALIVIDMVNDFVHSNGALTVGKPAQDIVPYICSLIEHGNHNNIETVFAYDWHYQFDFATTLKHQPPHCVDCWGREHYGPLKEYASKCHTCRKEHYNAFTHDALANYLERTGVKNVHLCGVCTDICVFATAMGAFDAGFLTTVHARGCATFTSRHTDALDHMKLCFGSRIID